MTSEDVQPWIENTTEFDRVYSVAATLSEPQPAPAIADEAHVDPEPTRTYLTQLADLGVLVSVGDNQPPLYYPDPLHTRMQALREVYEEYDRDGLVRQCEALHETLADWTDEYGADSATVLREQAAGADDPEQANSLRKVASRWDATAYQLSVVMEALRNYDAYADPCPDA